MPEQAPKIDLTGGGGKLVYDKARRTIVSQPKPCTAPTEPGYYWAKWMSAAPDTLEGDELTPALAWGVVEVWPNYLPPDLNDGEYLGVSVTGVATTQWLENFEWGPRVPPYSR